MSRKNRARPTASVRDAAAPQPSVQGAPAGKPWRAQDSFTNFLARTGYGTVNQASGATYSFDYISRNRVQLEAMYRSSWIVGQAVDVIAEDMTRAGITHESDMPPEDKAKIDAAFERMQLWDKLCDTIKWSRLYGGAIAVLLIDGQRMSEPFRPETVEPGQFKGLLPLDRWLVVPSLTQLVQELGPDFGLPMYYDVVADGMALQRQSIHYTRVLRFDGVDLPYWQKITENLWGMSVLERLFDRLIAFDSTTAGAAQLVYKAHLRTLKIKGLRDIISMGGPAMNALVQNIDLIRQYQSNEGITLLDGEDQFEVNQYAFSGLSEMLLQFGEQLSGALQIPLVRLFGQSPAGLNATGESDLANYRDTIRQKQERRLSSPLTRVIQTVARSEGVELPPDYNFVFTSLEQMGDDEKADIAQKVSTSVLEAYDAGVIDLEVALQELRALSKVTGIFSSISDEMIAEAKNAPPKISELPDGPKPPDAGQKPNSEEGAQSGAGAAGGNALRDPASQGGSTGGRPDQGVSA